MKFTSCKDKLFLGLYRKYSIKRELNMGSNTIRRIPPLKGDIGNEFMEKADKPVSKDLTPQEIAIYKAFIEKKKESKK